MVNRLFLWAGSVFLAMGSAEAGRIALYGYSGDNPVAASLQDQARVWGQACGAAGHTVAGMDIGGGNVNAFREGYGQELQTLPKLEDVNPYLQHQNVNRALSDRKTFTAFKEWLFNYGQAIVVLPCGTGALAGTLEAVKLAEEEFHHKPIYLLGSAYWSPLVESLKHTKLNLNSCHVTDEFPQDISFDTTEPSVKFSLKDRNDLSDISYVQSFYTPTQSIEPYLNHLIGYILEHHQANLVLQNKQSEFEPLKSVLDYLEAQGFLSAEHRKIVTFEVPNPHHG